jgi:hypothetical protein
VSSVRRRSGIGKDGEATLTRPTADRTLRREMTSADRTWLWRRERGGSLR